MQQATAQEPSQNVDMADYVQDQKVKEIRDRFFGGQRPSETPSQSYPAPQLASASRSDAREEASGSASPHGLPDPSIASPQQSSYGAMSNDNAGDDNLSAEARKSKRELSTSKRAAQNRAAQRAFRQRKEGYIRELEEKCKQFQSMEDSYRSLQEENHQLREYILNLQSQLLEHTRESSSSPPPGRKHAAHRDSTRKDSEQTRHSALPPHTESVRATQPDRPDGACRTSWSDHIDALRQRYPVQGEPSNQPGHRPSTDGDAAGSAPKG